MNTRTSLLKLWRSLPLLLAGAVLTYGCVTSAVTPDQNRTSMSVSGDQRCITGNGLPNHTVGAFPNPGNPHTVRTQATYRYCVDATPAKGAAPRDHEPTVAIALNGIVVRPSTADYWDPNSPRNHSRTGDRNWRLEGMGNFRALGMDQNNAHVDERGLYHYHGIPTGLVDWLKAHPDPDRSATLVAYAADGFEIHYVGSARRSSWSLKKGSRPSGPGGRYDGRYVADWEYTPGTGNLDKCNGGMLSDAHGSRFVYFVTASYPYWPRCFWGRVSRDFAGARSPGGPGRPGGPDGLPPGGRPGGFGPPPGGPPPRP
mgnify:CR=1 FL=1